MEVETSMRDLNKTLERLMEEGWCLYTEPRPLGAVAVDGEMKVLGTTFDFSERIERVAVLLVR